MKLIWTKSSSLISKLIRGITREDCSHFSIVFESKSSGLLFESNLLGTHPEFYLTSLKTHEVVHEKKLNLSIEMEDSIWDAVVQRYDDRGYDYLGALYLGIWKGLNRLFNIKLPSKNKWASSDKFYCVEIGEVFNIIPNFPKLEANNGMKTPHDLWVSLKDWEM